MAEPILDTWESQVADYVEYNRFFVDNERLEVERVDVKRRERPKRVRISKGELFDVISIERKRKNTYIFTAAGGLPRSHLFQPGQTVEYRSHVEHQDINGTTTTADRHSSKGVVTGKVESALSVVIEFSGSSDESHLFSLAPRGVTYMVPDVMVVEVEIAVDTVTFDRMSKALSLILAIDEKPLWLATALSSRTSSKADKSSVDKESIKTTDSDQIGKLSICSDQNPSQQRAIECAMQTQLTLIHGPPGTGKTHTAAALVETWLNDALNNQVALIVAQSNKAVSTKKQDQMTLSVIKRGLDPLRVGSMPKTHDTIMPYHVMEKLSHKITLFEDEEKRKVSWAERNEMFVEIFEKTKVICATCSGTMHSHLENFPRDKVGLIVMDEATQASEPECLVPLAQYCKAKVVFIGDQMQLPPTILSDIVRRSSEEYSLFGRLITFASEAECALTSKVMLDTQYRMHPAIAAFPSARFYASKLQNGVTSGERTPLPPKSLWPVVGNQRTPLLFLESSSPESRNTNTSYSNSGEADVVVAIVRRLQQSGVTRDQIGVISPYAGQVQVLKRRLSYFARGRSNSLADVLEVNSVDAFQGSEKEIIVFSAVRSNASGTVGFLSDFRRLNVALTRARRGLVVIGNPNTLQNDDHWKAWLEHAMPYRRLASEMLSSNNTNRKRNFRGPKGGGTSGKKRKSR